MLQVLDAAAVRRWCAAGRAGLAAARTEIDDLNVFPVPDGDTGTNLVLTMEAVEQAVRDAPADLVSTVRAMASGALLGARGNSGAILSQLLRGLAEAWESDGSAAGLRSGLARGAALARAGVARPVEGTLLTVAQDCADAVAGEPGDLLAVAAAARAAAVASLGRTTALLPELAAAGVVDAGGRGLCVLLEALERVVAEDAGVVAVDGADADGSPAAVPARAADGVPGAATQAVPSSDGASPVEPAQPSALGRARAGAAPGPAYEVQYLLRDADEPAAARLSQVLSQLGDSVVVVGSSSPGLYNVHAHVDDVGAALEAGLDAGRPFRISVTRFDDATAGRRAGGPRTGRSVVAVARGAGLAELLRSSGAQVVGDGPVPPTADDLLAAVRATAAEEIVLLPDDADLLAVAATAAAAARSEGCSVAVLPTRSSVQALAALAVADGSRPFEDDVAAMAEAAGSTRSGEVVVAVREAVTSAGICRAGDVLGVLDGDVVLLGRDVEAVARDLLDRMIGGGGELVTLVAGEGLPAGVAERVSAEVEHAHPAVEVVRYDGGQPGALLLLGVE